MDLSMIPSASAISLAGISRPSVFAALALMMTITSLVGAAQASRPASRQRAPNRHEKPDISDLVGLYAAIARMRVLSSTDVGERAERVAQRIPDTYSEPDKSFAEMRNMAMNHSIDLCMTSAKPAGR